MAPKILLVGNCQVRPIACLLERLNIIEEAQTIIVHLAKNSEYKEHENLLDRADVIVSQKIQDNYPCQTVRSSTIQEKYSHKTIFIPNLFYKGYTPDLRYLRLKQQGTLNGPLGDYHSSIILNCWKDGKSIEDTIRMYRSAKIWNERYRDAAQNSLSEYRRREEQLDIKLTKFIEKNLANQQLFFTFNHPSKALISKLVEKIASQLTLKSTGNSLAQLTEPLDRFQVPIHPFIQRQLELKFDGPTKFIGVGIKKNNSTERKSYRLKRLVILFFEHYNQNRQKIMEQGVWK